MTCVRTRTKDHELVDLEYESPVDRHQRAFRRRLIAVLLLAAVACLCVFFLVRAL
jgi:hypothetical protein